jgi:hypothetical protein
MDEFTHKARLLEVRIMELEENLGGENRWPSEKSGNLKN